MIEIQFISTKIKKIILLHNFFTCQPNSLHPFNHVFSSKFYPFSKNNFINLQQTFERCLLPFKMESLFVFQIKQRKTYIIQLKSFLQSPKTQLPLLIIIANQMSLKWYEQHLQQVVKENQTLKYHTKRKYDHKTVTEQITKTFTTLFPDIPPIIVTTTNPTVIQEQLSYYQKVASKWIQMVTAKLQIYEHTSPTDKPNLLYSLQKIQNQQKSKLNKTTIQSRDLCMRCGLHREQFSYDKLNGKIIMLEQKLKDLQKQINQREEQEEKYLKQISYLRSITKQLEFELAQQILNAQKTPNLTALKATQNQAELRQLRREVQIWKSEYDRVWKEHEKTKRKMNGNDLQNSKFQDERSLLNSIYKDEKDVAQSPSTSQNSNLWMIRSDELEHSYLVQTKSKTPFKYDHTTIRK